MAVVNAEELLNVSDTNDIAERFTVVTALHPPKVVLSYCVSAGKLIVVNAEHLKNTPLSRYSTNGILTVANE